MTYRKGILLTLACIALLYGCDENFTAGVIKAGSGNGKPKGSETGIVSEITPLNENYNVLLSAPKSDYCHGIKRTFQFLNPFTLDRVEKDQLFTINSRSGIDNQLILRVMLENKSDQSKTIFHPSCNHQVELKELEKEIMVNNTRCDIEKIASLAKNDIYIQDLTYSFTHTSNGLLKHSKNTEFLPREQNGLDCNELTINYKIQNIQK